jgi:hypothetical protein
MEESPPPEAPKKVNSDYSVGYGKPPKAFQFRKGQSGNPRGRRKNAKAWKTLLAEALNGTITVHENGEHRKISKREAAAIQLANRAAKGDLASLRLMVELLAEREERDEQASLANSGARERITARIDALSARIRAAHGLPPEEPNCV